jgi:hypothetical protein
MIRIPRIGRKVIQVKIGKFIVPNILFILDLSVSEN